MAGAQYTIPLVQVIPGQLITASLWLNEFNNIGTNFNPSGMDGYQDTTAQAQIQTAPYPSSVLSLQTNLGGEIATIRYQISAILGGTTPPYWYAKPPTDLTTLSNISIPIGGVIEFHASSGFGNNFLLANGQAIGRTTYAALNASYAALGYPFGSGDGSTTFNLPNYTNVFSMGAGGTYNPGVTGGAATHTLTNAEIPATSVSVSITDPGHTHTATDSGHTHGITDPSHSHTERGWSGSSGGNTGFQNAGIGSGSQVNSSLTTATSTTGVTVNSSTANVVNASNTTGITASGTVSGGGGSHSVLNPFMAMYKIIRVL